MDEREQVHYFHTICDFVDLVETYGIDQVAHDFKKTSPVVFEQLQKVVSIQRDKSKTAALLQYKDAFFKDYDVDTNS